MPLDRLLTHVLQFTAITEVCYLSMLRGVESLRDSVVYQKRRRSRVDLGQGRVPMHMDANSNQGGILWRK